jgi:hypothetical protein
MNPRDRIVTALPVQVLWTDEGDLSATRGRRLDGDAIRELLRRGPVRFVVASPGGPLRWVPLPEGFTFWKADVAPHLAVHDQICLEDFPDEVAYVASEWLADGSEPPIVLLEVHH